MQSINEAAEAFLAIRRVAVTGVSRTPKTHAGSVSAAATTYGRDHGINVIDGGCPLMFKPTADFGHKIMRRVLAGHVPKQA